MPDEEKRVERYARRTDEIRVAQEAGALTTSLDADMLHVLLLALAGYGALAPQVVRMITGVGTDDERYRAAVVEAARRLAAP